MLSTKAIEEYRAGLIRQFENKKNVLDAQQAQIVSEIRETQAVLIRLNSKIPNPEACPTCYYLAGVIALIRGIPADPVAPGIDRFRCANGHDF